MIDRRSRSLQRDAGTAEVCELIDVGLDLKTKTAGRFEHFLRLRACKGSLLAKDVTKERRLAVETRCYEPLPRRGQHCVADQVYIFFRVALVLGRHRMRR